MKQTKWVDEDIGYQPNPFYFPTFIKKIQNKENPRPSPVAHRFFSFPFYCGYPHTIKVKREMDPLFLFIYLFFCASRLKDIEIIFNLPTTSFPFIFHLGRDSATFATWQMSVNDTTLSWRGVGGKEEESLERWTEEKNKNKEPGKSVSNLFSLTGAVLSRPSVRRDCYRSQTETKSQTSYANKTWKPKNGRLGKINFLVFCIFGRHLGLSGTSPSLTLPPPPHPHKPQQPPSTLSDQAAAGGPDLQMDQHHQSNQMVTQGSARAICAALPGLVSRQIQVCQAHPNTIQSVSDGARKVTERLFSFLTSSLRYGTTQTNNRISTEVKPLAEIWKNKY